VKQRNPYVGDARTRMAKAKGYPARSVFKLEEIDQRCALFSPSMKVLDLGAAPGSWTMYAAKAVGEAGLVVAVDLKPITQPLPRNAFAVQADALSTENAPWTQYAPFDVVLSDMAPNTSGSKVRDQALSFELFMGALRVADELGKPTGSFVAKIFMSAEFSEAKSAVVRAYGNVRVLRPEGVRQNSSEVYVVGKGRPGT